MPGTCWSRARRDAVGVVIRVVLALVVVMILTGCARDEPATGLFRVGGLAPAGTAADLYWQRFAANLRHASAGALDPVMLTRGEVGSEEIILASLRRNRVQVSINGAFALSSVVPEMGVLSMPFLFETDQEVDFVVAGEVHEVLAELFRAQEVELITLLPMGWVNMFGGVPRLAPADYAGVRFRQPLDLASQAFAQGLAADLIPLPSTELVSALQTGLIDAGATITLGYLWNGVAAEAPEFTLTQHAFLVNALLFNGVWWGSLSADEQALIRGAVPPMSEFVALMRDSICRDLATVAPRDGIRVRRLTEAQRAEWRALALSMHQPMIAAIGGRAEEVYAAVQRGKAAFGAKGRTPQAAGAAACPSI